jgi:protein-tyrosine phosphatase
VTGDVLVLCTANQCRSPMAAALLRQRLAARGVPVAVRSAGLLPGGRPPPPEVIAVMAGHGTDVSGHRSTQATAADLAGAGLILAMARAQLRQAIVLDPGAWPRAFTLRELVRRGQAAGRRQAGESLAGWLGRVHAGRQRLALLGESAADDVADPMGGPRAGYDGTAAQLAGLADRLTELCWAYPDRVG